MRLSFGNGARRPTLTLGVAVGVYLLAIIVPALLGQYAFVVKTAVAPVLFIAAAVLGRLRSFIRDWSLFLGLTILFDFLRGLIYWITVSGERPFYMGYVIDLERFLGGGRVLTVILQDLLCDPPKIRFLEKFLVVVHGSHFLVFLLLGFVVWQLRREDFKRFKAGLVGVMYVGLVFYFLVPTVPPWMASLWYQAIPQIFHFPEHVYNATVPSLYASFDTNLIAAMPSLHTAFPAFFCCVAFHVFGRRGFVVLLYLLAVVFSLVCSGEHYLVDVLAGAILGGAMYLLAFRVKALAAGLQGYNGPEPGWRSTLLSWRVLVALLIIAGSQIGANQLAGKDIQLRATGDFIENELKGRTNTAHYYRGLMHESADRDLQAQREYSLAVNELGTTPLAGRARLRLGRTAHRNGDHRTTVSALGGLPLDRLEPMTAVMLGVSMLRQGAGERALDVFSRVQGNNPGEPTSLYWQTRLLYQNGRISEEQLRVAVARLRARSGDVAAMQMADHLVSMVRGKESQTP